MSALLAYLANTTVRPQRAFSRLLADPYHLRHGLTALLLIGLLYTLTVAGLAFAGAEIMLAPWVALPAVNYYFAEIFFAAPVFFLGWLLSAGLIHLLSLPLGGRGTYEGTLAVLGMAMTLPSFVMWLHETIATVLFLTGLLTQAEWLTMRSQPGFWKLFWDAYQFVALGWYALLFSLAARVAQKIPWWVAIGVGTLALAVVAFFMLLFIR